MNIIIVGCGKVGETLASVLCSDGNDITVIDLSQERVNAITSRLDVMGVIGNGATYTVLKEAGIASADLLIAVTDSDELNLLCCMMAKKNGKCHVIAKVQNPEYSTESAYLKDELGLAMVINPEHAAAEEISRVLRFPAATRIETFAKGRVELVKFRLSDDCVLVGMTVADIVKKLKCDILVCTIERDGEAFIANGSFKFEKRDLVSFVSSPKKSANFFKKINYTNHSVNDVMIVGAGETTHYLCKILERTGIQIKVVEKNLALCEDLNASNPSVTVINGAQTEHELLIEEGIEKADAFVSLSESDEENILLSIFANNSKNPKVITRINNPEYDDITSRLNLDTVIFPKRITSDMIVRYVRAMTSAMSSNVETMYNLIKDKVEATEFKVGEGAPVIGVPISEILFKEDVIVASILRGKSVIIPRGNDKIQAGDSVVIVTKILGLRDIADTLL